MTTVHQHPLQKILDSRIAIIDGAMGTTIRTYGMKEADIRGERFKDSTKDLRQTSESWYLSSLNGRPRAAFEIRGQIR